MWWARSWRGTHPGAKAPVVVGFDVRAEARTYLEATTAAEQIPMGNDRKKGNCTRLARPELRSRWALRKLWRRVGDSNPR
jgi:hypothetical protein